jgi:hypothetical protein
LSAATAICLWLSSVWLGGGGAPSTVLTCSRASSGRSGPTSGDTSGASAGATVVAGSSTASLGAVLLPGVSAPRGAALAVLLIGLLLLWSALNDGGWRIHLAGDRDRSDRPQDNINSAYIGSAWYLNSDGLSGIDTARIKGRHINHRRWWWRFGLGVVSAAIVIVVAATARVPSIVRVLTARPTGWGDADRLRSRWSHDGLRRARSRQNEVFARIQVRQPVFTDVIRLGCLSRNKNPLSVTKIRSVDLNLCPGKWISILILDCACDDASRNQLKIDINGTASSNGDRYSRPAKRLLTIFLSEKGIGRHRDAILSGLNISERELPVVVRLRASATAAASTASGPTATAATPAATIGCSCRACGIASCRAASRLTTTATAAITAASGVGRTLRSGGAAATRRQCVRGLCAKVI